MYTSRFLLIFIICFLSFPQVFAEIRIYGIDSTFKAREIDIRFVLNSVNLEFGKFFPEKNISIDIERTYDNPIYYFRKSTQGYDRIGLNVDGLYWSQFAYQYGHELCHAIIGDRKNNEFQWFEEVICETASLYILKSMGKSWKKSYADVHWGKYSDWLEDYAQNRLNDYGGLDIPPPLFYVTNHRDIVVLGDNPLVFDRPLITRIAIELLPIFERSPDHWSEIVHLKKVLAGKSKTIKSLLDEWSRAAHYSPLPLEIARVLLIL